MPGLGRDLVVNLAGNNAKLKSTIAESKGGLKGFASVATSMLNPVTAGFAAVAAGAASAGVAVYMFAGRISELAGIADQATQTGLSGAFLQRLGYAADQSGVSVETLTGGIKKLTIAVGKGDTKPFESLGLNLAEIKAMRPEDQFKAVAEAISKLPTASERAAAAVKIFGKSGIEMTGLFAGGMNDLNALLADAASLGIGVSDDGLAKAAAADDAIQRMKASFGAFLDQLTVGVAPLFKDVTDYIAGWIPPLTEFIGKFNGLSDKAGFLGEAFQAGMDVGIETIKEHWNEMLDDMVKASLASALQIADNMNPKTILKNLSIVTGIGQAKPAGNPQATPLQNAKDRFSGVMSQLNNSASTVAPVDNLPTPTPTKDDGSKVKALFGSLAESATSMFGEVSQAVQTEFTGLTVQGGYLGSIVKNMFGVGHGNKPKEKPQKESQLQFASAMQKGSSEAFQTIMRSMTRSKDPVVAATEKQTAALLKGLKPPEAPQFAPEF